MTRILVVSDSHGNAERLRRIIDREKHFDYLVHCGDGVNDLMHVNIPGEATVLSVTGNVDVGRGLTGERIIHTVIGDKKFMITHGDLFGAHNGLYLLEKEAKKVGADIVLFGHTHIKYLREGIPLLFNPGSANNGLYAIVEIDREISCSHHLSA